MPWLIVAASLSLAACIRTEVASLASSPGGSYAAVVRIADAGALSSVTQTVSVRDLRANGRETEVLVTTGAQKISLRWIDDTDLAIECPRCDPGRVELKKDRVGTVNLHYPQFGAQFRNE